ncbi:MAG: acyl-CoA/acyl-ACP dehydrogenase, partial [Planctomycetales bacterium]
MDAGSPDKKNRRRRPAASFVETALTLSGKSEEEARSTGAMDKADDDVEAIFAPKYKTSGSPVHVAVWGDSVPVDQFSSQEPRTTPGVQEVCDKAFAIVQRRTKENSLHDENGKISEESLDELAGVGYWGLLIDKEYGGHGASFGEFARFITRMATVNGTAAGLASVHGCIGAVDPIRTFATPEQKQKYLPRLASGERLSAFALTEPGAGSDLTAPKTTATLEGDHYVINGEKLCITNASCGRTIGLVCLIDEKPAVLIVDLPDQESDQFQIVPYGLYALREAHNNGLRFKNFRVPKDSLLVPSHGDGLTIAYHGLNRGRVALCANA